ncbi:aldose 1-epimerase family protein [Cesiribacter sp. SM1]|uniref:aldose 1-epimerase family protein n=1 Tax=Cesiribacter sp. SM1 TaxID=2861196 RepID=UPI001CD45757|nr:aldose 1-epimerase family protein [Cesiribacter sp. SM1]
MLHTLENSLVVATFKEQGAELCSFRRKDNGLEYIWGGNPDIWGRHAPILFPIVGRLNQNKYSLDGQEYNLSQHGFARDKKWATAKEGTDRILFRLTSDADTRLHYPFDFELLLEYHLENNKLVTTYRVKNVGTGDMLFSIGAHPAFRCPLRPEEAFEDYYLEFEKVETLDRQLLHHGLRTGEKRQVMDNEMMLPLHADLFNEDALVFKGIKSSYINLKNNKNTHSVRVDLAGFPYVGIWTKAGEAPFICIEPWYGVTDKAGTEGEDFRKKEGIQHLLPGSKFECSYAITID